ncbi:hypothetical protein DAH55_02435 [Sphingomonas koreensis]|uniref:hypothetical protein n=1 Tax=Sphingomonas koreensis TaxID=93064 RepID=UPI00082B3FCE|nr:hypothetical protein [Sphingomonas koreensis]PJI87867.1 hypothetical protein BDW16_1112 [Sphingomonas koreensis]RSU58373.1 hypothetical protein DAH56_15655 [Sphingomonas koreensis]RSU71914.1 hypothetical protein DAH55_02435 [Sphingomonas koreensis]
MKKLLGGMLALILGAGVGGGSAWGIGMVRQNVGAAGSVRTEFVETGAMMAPLVFPDGRLSGYVSFQVQLEVPQGEGEAVKAKLPLLLNAVNLRTYRTPMASGRDGLIPGLDAFRRVVMDAARETYGPDTVRRAVVTQASPA